MPWIPAFAGMTSQWIAACAGCASALYPPNEVRDDDGNVSASINRGPKAPGGFRLLFTPYGSPQRYLLKLQSKGSRKVLQVITEHSHRPV